MMKRILATISLLVALLTGVQAETGAAWWGLWNSSMATSQRALLEAGANHLHVRLTAQNSPLLVGGTISGLRFMVDDKTAIRKATAWVARSYSQGPTSVVASKEIPLAELRDQQSAQALGGQQSAQALTEVLFDEPINVLPAGNAYANILVGVTLEVASQPLAYLMTGPSPGVTGSCFVNGRDASSTYGPLALQVLASGPLLAEHAASLDDVGEQVVRAGRTVTIALPVRQTGTSPLTSIDYVATVGAQQQPLHHYDLPAPLDELGQTAVVPFEVIVPDEAAEHTLQLTLSGVNGQPNAQESSVTIPLVALARDCQKRTVMEEFTGTWCHNCVRGIVGIQRLEEQYGDRFIAIAMHSEDPMQVDAYKYSNFYRERMKILGGLPSCSIDRLIDCDPYCGFNTTGDFLTDQLVDYALQVKAVADVSVSAALDGQGGVGCSVATAFGYASPDAHYSLMLVLLADSLTGEGQQWQQRNGYNDYTGQDPALTPYAGIGQYIRDITFSHVAIDVSGVDGGIEGSILAPLESHRQQQFDYTFDISQNPLVQDLTKLHVVAMLLDTRTGQVVNAAICHVAEGSAGVDHVAVQAPSQAPRRFTLSGQPAAGSRRPGIVVERTADGRYRKVVTHSP